MSILAVFNSDFYPDGRTKQAFKDQTDINKILKKAQRLGSLSHLVKHGAHYGDYSDVPSLLEAHERIRAGQRVFEDLPSEVKREFNNDQFKFFAFVNDPANADRLRTVLPALAAPGAQLPAVRRSALTEADPRFASAPPTAPASSPSDQPGASPTASSPSSSST